MKRETLSIQQRETEHLLGGETLRIVWAVAAKDIVDAIRNKTTIGVILGVALLMLSSQALPLMARLSDVHRVVLFDPGQSDLLTGLNRDAEIRVARVASLAELQETLGESSGTMLGLVVPADLDRALETEQPLELDGYFAHWVGKADAAEARDFFQARLTELTGKPVRVNTAGHTVYPGPDSDGQPFMSALSLVVAIITISTVLVPYLIIEEKETRTMDALLVSPARIRHIIAGKAVAGMVYGLAAAAVVFAFNRALVVHWGWAILAAIVGALFAVALGLLMGSIFDNPQNLSLWMGVVLALLLIPVMLSSLAVQLPPLLEAVLPWIPSTVLTRAFQISFSGDVPLTDILSRLGLVTACTVVLLAGVVWVVRRSDR